MLFWLMIAAAVAIALFVTVPILVWVAAIFQDSP